MSKFIHIFTFLISTLIISASAQLSGRCTQGSVRLRGSLLPRQGRVEVCNRNTWGTVCDDFFDNTDAGVVCSQLGFSDRGAQVISSGYRRGSFFFQQIFLDDVDCNGTEDSIFNCSARPIGSHNCRHSEDVGVRCMVNRFGDIRLRGRETVSSGRVEVFNGTAWGTVCDDWWSSNDATVACRQLGFSTQGARVLRLGNGYAQLPTTSLVPIVLDNLRCTGSEFRLTSCPHNGIGVHNCRHNEDAGVQCGALQLKIASHELDEDESMEDETSKQVAAESNGETEKESKKEEQVDKQSEDLALNARVLNALQKIFVEE